MKTKAIITIVGSAFGVSLLPGIVSGQSGHDGPPSKHESHDHAATSTPSTLASALHEIADRMSKLDSLLSEGNLEAAHDESDAIGVLAKSLGALALRSDSGVPRNNVKEVNKAGKALAEASDGVHEAGQKNDLAAAKLAFDRMRTAAQTLSKATGVPASERAAAGVDRYACPMHDEGEKTYDKPGKCPVCGMTLKKQTTEAFSATIEHPDGPIQPGKPVRLSISLRDPAGRPVSSLETVHEKILHLLIVSNDLSWFTHEHPALQPDGTFTLTYTFPQGGEYTLFHDFSPLGVGQQVVRAPITAEGTAPAPVPLVADKAVPKLIDGYTVSVEISTGGGGPPRTDTNTHVSFTLTKGGTPVTTLAPYLGAMGHLVIISSDRAEFVHSHPHEPGAGTHEHHTLVPAPAPDRTGGPKVEFEAHFRAPGVYKAWGQFNVGTRNAEKVLTVPFTFVVDKAAQEPTSDHGSASEHHQ